MRISIRFKIIIFSFIIFKLSIGSDLFDNKYSTKKIQLNTIKQLLQTNDTEKAFEVAHFLQKKFRDDPEVNYLFSIILLKIRGDLIGAKKYYRLAKEKDNSLPSPINLPPNEIEKLLMPTRLNLADFTLYQNLKQINQLIEREQWTEAKTIVDVSSQYVNKCSDDSLINSFYLRGLIIFTKLNYKILGLKYFNLIQPDYLLPEDIAIYKKLEPNWTEQNEKFVNSYSSPEAVFNEIVSYLNNRKYETALIFIDEIKPLLPEKLNYNILIHYYLAKIYLELNNFKKTRIELTKIDSLTQLTRISQSISNEIENLKNNLILKTTLFAISKKQRKADSLMLEGNYYAGKNIYDEIIRERKELKISLEPIYFILARILMKVGKYDVAEDYINKINFSVVTKESTQALKDSILGAKLYERQWEKEMDDYEKLLAEGEIDSLDQKILRLIHSPYFRPGLRAKTFFLLSEIFKKQSKYGRASEAYEFAKKYLVTSNQIDWVNERIKDIINKRNLFSTLIKTKPEKLSIKIDAYHTKPIKIRTFHRSFSHDEIPKEHILNSKTGVPIIFKSGRISIISIEDRQYWSNMKTGAYLLSAIGLLQLSQ